MSAPARRPRDTDAEPDLAARRRARRGRRSPEERAATRARRRDSPRSPGDEGAVRQPHPDEPAVPIRRSHRASAEAAAPARPARRAAAPEADPSARPRRARDRRGDAKRRPRSSAGARADAPARPERGDRPGRLGRARAFAAERVRGRRARADRQRSPGQPQEAGAGRASFVVAIIALLVVGVAATLWLSTQAIADSYRLEKAKADADRLAEQVAVLQREVATLESAPELARRARELGMVPAGDAAWLVVTPDGKVSVVGEPTPVPSPAPTTTDPATSGDEP